MGKNHNGYFDINNFLRQVNNTINIFKGLTKGWINHPNNPHMHSGMLLNGKHQPFYFSENYPSISS
jgi:hypothetical protein